VGEESTCRASATHPPTLTLPTSRVDWTEPRKGGGDSVQSPLVSDDGDSAPRHQSQQPTTHPDLAIIDQLCEWSFSPDPQVARAASSALIGSIIETLCDDFSERGVTLANLVLTQILAYIRATPEGAELNQRLLDFAFTDSTAILEHYRKIRHRPPLPPEELSRVKKVLILSRVTAGADIAITSVIVQRLRRRLPEAELVLIGPPHLPELFSSVANCRHRRFVYKNDGTLFDKMTSWPRLLEISQEEQAGHQPGEVLLFDPDTRLTQLGLLPLAADAFTCYFPSRDCEPQAAPGRNLSALTNQWLDHLLGETAALNPRLTFQHQGEGYHPFSQGLHDRGCRLVVTINFGVGNDPRKKVHGSFEQDLIQSLLTLPGTIVILDIGQGQLKGQWIADHLARVRQQGLPAACLTDSFQSPLVLDGEAEVTTNPIHFGHGLIIFKGSLRSLGKMIDAADCFIGYDSCGQHLAAATGTPAIIVFAGAPSAKFIERWSPESPVNLTIPFNSTATPREIEQLIEQISRAVAQFRATRSLQ
jgi:hypothetical protein